jgi:predicted PurR-regulated permease PerM
MKRNSKEMILPGYVKVAANLISLTIVIAFAFIAKDIIMPILFAILISILILPANKFLERFAVPRLLAIILTIGIGTGMLTLLIYFLSFQISSFTDDIPALTQNVNGHIKTLQDWIKSTFNINYKSQLAYITEATDKTMASGTALVGETVLRISGIFVFLVLVPIYCFFILLYRGTIKAFLMALFAKEGQRRIEKVLVETKFIVQN